MPGWDRLRRADQANGWQRQRDSKRALLRGQPEHLERELSQGSPKRSEVSWHHDTVGPQQNRRPQGVAMEILGIVVGIVLVAAGLVFAVGGLGKVKSGFSGGKLKVEGPAWLALVALGLFAMFFPFLQGGDDEDGDDPAAQPTLLVDIARLRDRASLNGEVVDTLEGLAGDPIDVLRGPVNGWYEVRVGRQQGWVFGAFILPAAEGHDVVRTQNGDRVELLDSSGNELDVTNQSGSYALVVEASGEFWQVLLPDGDSAFIDPQAVRLVS